MSRVRALLTAVGSAVALVVLAGCSAEVPMPTPTPTETFAVTGDGVLRFGTLLPFTGDDAASGQSQAAGIELAVREINLAGGVLGAPVEVLHRNAVDAAGATAAFAALLERGVDVVIGPANAELLDAIVPEAAAAGIPIISPSLTTTAVEDAAVFGLAAPYSAQAGELGELLGAVTERVALVYLDTPDGQALADSLHESVEQHGSRLAVATAVAEGETDFSRMIAAVKKSRADAVVLATPSAESAAALITELGTAGFGGDRLWLTTGNSGSYGGLFEPGYLEGAHGLLEGSVVPAAYLAALAQSDPELSSTAFAREAHDAVVLAALAVVTGGDDGGPSITRALRAGSVDGIPCASFAECLSVLETEPAVAYRGDSGTHDFTAASGGSTGTYTVLVYAVDNSPMVVAD